MTDVKNDSPDDLEKDPNEEADAERCDASKLQCDLEPSDMQDEDEAIGWEREDEMFDAYQPEDIKLVASPEDSMPIPADESDSLNLALAPAFTRENVICVGDDREYVERFKQEFSLPKALRATTGLGHMRTKPVVDVRPKYDMDGKENVRRRFARNRVEKRWGKSFVMSEGQLVPVRPSRPACKYYKRQAFAKKGIDKGEDGHLDVARNCIMRRSIGGAFLSLNNEAVYACEYRDPPEPDSVERVLEKPDCKRLDGPPPERVPMFGLG